METRPLKIGKETAERWYNGSDEELKQLALTAFPELGVKKLPESWEELGEIEGYYLDAYSEILKAKTKCLKQNQNVFKHENQVEAVKAFAKLSHLKDEYNGEWKADWMDENKAKWCIISVRNEWKIFSFFTTGRFLSFKDQQTAEDFLRLFKEDIEKLIPLMS